MWRYNAELGTIDITGHSFASTRKYRNAKANPKAALVVDDIVSLDPYRPRAVVVEGPAEAIPPSGDVTEALIRIIPERIISWGLDDPA
jgi:pyridoxamine 5'-phosphate oxidase family protein